MRDTQSSPSNAEDLARVIHLAHIVPRVNSWIMRKYQNTNSPVGEGKLKRHIDVMRWQRTAGLDFCRCSIDIELLTCSEIPVTLASASLKLVVRHSQKYRDVQQFANILMQKRQQN